MHFKWVGIRRLDVQLTTLYKSEFTRNFLQPSSMHIVLCDISHGDAASLLQ